MSEVKYNTNTEVDMQAVVCCASSSLAVAVATVQVGGGTSGLLGFLITAWALLLPVGLVFQALLPLPPPEGALPYGGLTPLFQRERAEAFRCCFCLSSTAPG